MEETVKYMLMDLDNTFLAPDKSIPEENIEALRLAKENGMKVILASGRSNMSLDVYAKRLGLDYEGNYIIAYNGCRIYEAKSKAVISENLLDNKTACHICRIVALEAENTLLYKDSRLYTQNITDITKRYAKNSSLELNQAESLADIAAEGEIQKIIMIGEHDRLFDVYKTVCESLDQSIDAEMFFSSEDLFEFSAKGKSKGTALVELAEYLGEPMTAFAAIGDNQNDVEMIAKAGFGIAVGNAVEECKKAARYVTVRDCAGGGFAEAVLCIISANRGKSPK